MGRIETQQANQIQLKASKENTAEAGNHKQVSNEKAQDVTLGKA